MVVLIEVIKPSQALEPPAHRTTPLPPEPSAQRREPRFAFGKMSQEQQRNLLPGPPGWHSNSQNIKNKVTDNLSSGLWWQPGYNPRNSASQQVPVFQESRS